MLKEYYVTVSERGQICLPMKIRNSLDILIGGKVEIMKKDNCVVVMPINKSLSSLKNAIPKPKKALSIEEMDNSIREAAYDCN